MFLELLTPAQRELFVRAATQIFAAGGGPHPEEQSFLEAVMLESDVNEDPSALREDELLRVAPDLLRDPTQRRAFLLELAGVVFIDAPHPQEIETFNRFAHVLDLEHEADDFREFAADARALATRGRDLISTERDG
ncbi:MAG: hypothetical protein DYH12_03020 [Sorangiineae bacterium PRO1]|nr:hypothetical protein [Sorangiineae bacterium PRO1]